MVAGCQRSYQRDPKYSKVEPARDRWNCDNDYRVASLSALVLAIVGTSVARNVNANYRGGA